MEQNLQISIDDTSPTIFYSPSADTFAGANLTAGWNPYFNSSGLVTSIGQIGIGTSFHITSRDNAALSITWKGTGVQLLGYTQQNASYTLDLDGTPKNIEGANPSNNILAAFQNIPDGTHTLTIITVIPGNEGTIFFDRAIVYFNAPARGQWGLENIDGSSYHQSQNKGDIALTTFTGTYAHEISGKGGPLLITGATSPSAGTYAITLDNVTSTFTGQSSSTNTDVVLFYATDLDPTITHDVQIKNEDGGNLSLKVAGFQVFSTGLARLFDSAQPSPTSTHVSTAALSKGTTAALVLAGVLGFLIISGSLFFVCIIRPERRRERLARIERRRRKAQEDDPLDVLNIAPNAYPEDPEIPSDSGGPGHHQKSSSGKSGFTRWKREVEGGFGGLNLGITFRHSGSTGRRSGISRASEGESAPLSAKSSMFTTSSSKRHWGKGKGKMKKPKNPSESSWSASYALDLPIRPDSADSLKEKDNGPSRLSIENRHSISDVHTLSYMNTPSPQPVSLPLPPSYSQSRSNSLSAPQSILRASTNGHSSHQSHSHHRQNSATVLLTDNELIPRPEDDDINQPFVTTLSPPSDTRHLSTLPPRDRGSAQYSSDDATSMLGVATTRLAIRGLSPRTSQSPMVASSTQVHETRVQKETPDRNAGVDFADPRPAPSIRPLPSPPTSNTSFLNVITPTVTPASQPIEILQHENTALEVHPASPSAVDFRLSQLENDSHIIEPTSIVVSRQESSTLEEQSTRNLRSVFRLTPPSNPPSSHGRGSFLDLGASSDRSSGSQSIVASDASSGSQQVESFQPSQTLNVSPSAISQRSGPTAYFPFPISLPPSPHHPEGHIPSRINTLHQVSDRHVIQALRLSAFGSPTDSVPTSVTERRLRHSGSTADSGTAAHSSQLPPHPPLPNVRSDSLRPPP
ncbi:hypothetical protein H0H93_006644 [Arthromyces matolae]|nr:hypothetical protein H0H93_006644 [Arthromyces matolae]